MSSACDLSFWCISIIISRLTKQHFRYLAKPTSKGFQAEALFVRILYNSKHSSIVFGMDSDLEAFSHYPADGSFAALAFQPAANTNYLNEGFLSY